MVAISRRLRNRRRSRVGGRPEEASPLVDAIQKKNIEQIEKILNTNPKAVFEEDKDGETPLHKAFYYNIDNEIFAKILNANPEAAAKKDNNGNYPMHHITDYGQGQTESFNQTLNAKLLYNVYPSSAWEDGLFEDKKQTPLEMGMGWYLDPIFITFLYAVERAASSERDLNTVLKETAQQLMQLTEPEKHKPEKETKHEKAAEPEKETKHEKAAEPEKKKGWFSSLSFGKKGGKQSRRRNLRK